jgi:predicted phage terminase large subunit-like protein
LPPEVLNPNNERVAVAFAAKGFRSLSSALTLPRYDYRDFLSQAWPILEPANPLLHDWYIDAICEHLQLVTDGQIQKLLINIPPRFGKSNLVTILWPAWTWTVKPFLRFISCSYSASLSVKHSVDRRRVIESPWYQDQWGSLVNFRDDQNMKNEYENTARGHMLATSVGGTLTGKGGDVIIEDDMINPSEAESDASRSHAITMHQSVLSSRLDNPKRGIRVVVEQRTHHRDLTGHILATETGWTHLNLPLIAEKRSVVVLPVSKREIIREENSILNPSRYGRKECDDLKQIMGTRTFTAQCQQNPTAEIGNILKRSWWKRWKVLPSGFNFLVTSWDMSFKETESGSYVVGQVWGRRGADYFLLAQTRQRMDFTDALNALINLSRQYPLATGHLVEDKANGPAIISALQGKISGIVPIEPHGSKIARAQAVSPIVEAGNVHLPDESTCAWVADFIEECAAFTGGDGEINDQVDAATQALFWMSQARLIDASELADEGSFIEDSNFGGGFSA